MSNDPQSPTPASQGNPESLQEPSVLDYLKSRLSFGRGGHIEIPVQEEGELEPQPPEPAEKRRPFAPIPWRSLLALGLALLAQWILDPPWRIIEYGVALYVFALLFLLWAIFRREWILDSLGESAVARDPLTFHRNAFLISLILALMAFFLFSGNQFTGLNLSIWLITLAIFTWSLWLRTPNTASWWQRVRAFLTGRNWQINITPWTLLIIAATVLVVFFRFYHIQQTPAEPFSDHAEKALDLFDITQGQTRIFFPRNTGREAIGMYWLILTDWIFSTGISFLTMKIGTILMGLFTLPYVYLLGKEIANRRVGLLAFILTGVAYWPNVISRIGLRFPLYPLFAAPTLLYLIRGLRRGTRNDFILAGIFLGLGLHGYTPARIVPFLVVVAFGLFLLHAQSRGVKRDVMVWLAIVTLVSIFVFLPLLRYATENPEMFSFRALSRVENIEQPLPGPWYQIFFSNLWNALKMFNWDDGNIWVNSLPHRPALDIVTGALFLIGMVLILVRYFQKRHWLDLFLILSVPILQLPSILSLAYPDENPALNRAAAAYIPAFIFVAIALDSLMAAVERRADPSAVGKGKGRTVWAWILAILLIYGSAAQSFDITFRQFDQNYRNGAWNTSEMGEVIKEFGLVYGETDTVWIVPFPYWVDTRLPGVWAGIPNRDFAIWPDQLSQTLQSSGPKLFIVKANLQDPSANDQKSLDALKQMYPLGTLSLHQSSIPGHDFWIYFVPAPASS